jgi:predicted O-methyltransferase YrrM
MASTSQSKYLAPREVWEKMIAEHMKEVDPNWIAIDKLTASHLGHEPEIVNTAINRIADAGIPPIACAPVQAKFMALAAYANLTTQALEIGTLGGLTAIRLAISNPQLRVTTIELHEVYATFARQNIKEAGLEDRIEVLVGPAMEVMPKLAREIEEGKRQKFGLTLIDADSVCKFPERDDVQTTD